jgi:hypothetical protein
VVSPGNFIFSERSIGLREPRLVWLEVACATRADAESDSTDAKIMTTPLIAAKLIESQFITSPYLGFCGRVTIGCLVDLPDIVRTRDSGGVPPK